MMPAFWNRFGPCALFWNVHGRKLRSRIVRQVRIELFGVGSVRKTRRVCHHYQRFQVCLSPDRVPVSAGEITRKQDLVAIKEGFPVPVA